MQARWLWCAARLIVGAFACSSSESPEPDPDRFRQPTGAVLSPDGNVLFVANGNLDLLESGSTIVIVDLDELHTSIDRVSNGDRDDRCERDGESVIRCGESAFIDADRTVVVGTGTTNVVVDRPGDPARYRLLVPLRSDAELAWIEVIGSGDELRLECGQTSDRRCDRSHMVARAANGTHIPSQPARMAVDTYGFRLAYLPHLVDGTISLFRLDGEIGPELVDVRNEFYRPDPYQVLNLAGGFAVAQRACTTDSAPAPSRDCTRPYLYTTERFWPGIRTFTVAPGFGAIIPGSEVALLGLNPELAEGRPYTGDLVFEDPLVGDRLLVVHTTPPGLSRVDTSIDENGSSRNDVMATISLCNDPNLIVVHASPSSEALAFVSCFAADAVAVVELARFDVVKTLAVGDGPNEMVVDSARSVLYVVNTRESSLSIVGLDAARPDYLSERARVGQTSTQAR